MQRGYLLERSSEEAVAFPFWSFLRDAEDYSKDKSEQAASSKADAARQIEIIDVDALSSDDEGNDSTTLDRPVPQDKLSKASFREIHHGPDVGAQESPKPLSALSDTTRDRCPCDPSLREFGTIGSALRKATSQKPRNGVPAIQHQGRLVPCESCAQEGLRCREDAYSMSGIPCVACRRQGKTDCNMFFLLDFKPLKKG